MQGVSIIYKEKIPNVFYLPFDQYLEMTDKERMQIDINAWDKNRAWIERELDDRDAEWMLVIADEIVEWSDSLDNYPTSNKLEKLGKRYNLVPWVFVRPPLIEETSNVNGKSSWSALGRDDYYPTLMVVAGNPGWDEKQIRNSGQSIVADIDTGCNRLFLDYNRVAENRIVIRTVLSRLQRAEHLGRRFSFYVFDIRIGVCDISGKMKIRNFSSYCVLNWSHSPFCLINPNRKALIGRNLILDFPLRLELDGGIRRTAVHHVRSN